MFIYMKKIIVWLLSIIKFILVKKRFLLISPPFFKKQYWFDRLNNKKFVTVNRDDTDWGTSWQVFLDEQFALLDNIFNDSRSKDLTEYMNTQISKGRRPIIIDCGSNSGASCIYFNLTYPGSKVIGIEIDKSNSEHSKKNIELNSIDALILNKGIGCEDGFGQIANPGADNNSYRITEHLDASDKIEIISIQKILKDYPKDKFFPLIVKIDIEGGEDDLFSKNTDWVKEIPMIIIELHDWLMPKQNTSINFLKTISNHDRDFNIKGENVFSIKNILN